VVSEQLMATPLLVNQSINFSGRKDLVCKEDRNGHAFNKALATYRQKLTALLASRGVTQVS
jgi:hypothetical protein